MNNNNNNGRASKRARKNKHKSVTFKNSVNVKNLNVEENARSYRKSVKRNTANRNELPAYMTNHSELMSKINRINSHKRDTLYLLMLKKMHGHKNNLNTLYR